MVGQSVQKDVGDAVWGMIKKCKECRKKKEHHAKGFCGQCYSRLRFRNLPYKEKIKKRKYDRVWRENNRDRYNTRMRLVMRKKLNIKQRNFRVYERLF